MKNVLEILPVSIDADNCTLICEVSNEGFSYAIKDNQTNTYIGVSVSHFNKSSEADDYLSKLENSLQHQPLLSGNFKKIYMIYSFEESVLIPFPLYDSQQNANALNLIHGDLQNNTSVLTDVIAEKAVYNSYRISTPLLVITRSKFPEAINRHQYSILLKQVSTGENKLSVIFYSKKIVLTLIKNGAAQFINSFQYKSAEDVSYILLNTCKQFNSENIPVEISGLIEMDSSLSKEIYKYFNYISFQGLPADSNYSEEIIKHPAHYFSHIFAVDL